MNIIYCSIEPNNPVDLIEIERLSKNANVIVVTTSDGYLEDAGEKIRFLNCAGLGHLMLKAWLKLATLICRLPNSNTAKRFPERNVYLKSRILTFVSNLFWHLRKFEWINKNLPSYSSLIYLVPWEVLEEVDDPEVLNADIIVYNSLHIVSANFIPLIKRMKKKGVMTVANVRSWDNPYYIQFDTQAQRYLVWSPFMAETIAKAQGIGNERLGYQPWGPNLIKRFVDLCRRDMLQISNNSASQGSRSEILIGYAAAFGDVTLAKAEYRFICELSRLISKSGIDAKILYRPYPTVHSELLKASHADEDVLIYEINSEPVDRYGDGREIIRFGSPEERHIFLESCTFFLSLATTFTLEAMVYGVDVLHLHLPPSQRKNPDEVTLFERVELSCDHFFDYFHKKIEFIPNKESFVVRLKERMGSMHEGSAGLDRVGLSYLSNEVRLP